MGWGGDGRPRPTIAAQPHSVVRHAAETVRLATPLAAAQLSQMAMALTDAVMLGSLGPLPLAAGGLGAAIFFTLLIVLQGMLTPVSVFAAEARGARRRAACPMSSRPDCCSPCCSRFRRSQC